ncbi:addiction module protein [bacterium]|nr:addiction module protein [bacterium]
MNQRLQELSLELLGLPIKSRAYLAARLLESLDEDEDEINDQMWMDEINRRLADVREGKAELIPVEDVIKELKASLGH